MIQVSVVTQTLYDQIDRLNQTYPNCHFIAGEEGIENSTIVWGDLAVDKVSACHNLQWMQSASAGVDRYLNEIFPNNATLTNSTGAYNLAIAEYMLGVHLSLLRKLHLYRDRQATHDWGCLGKVTSIHGSTVLVLGMGGIGGEYAKRVKALGGYVIGVRRTDARKPDYVDELHLTDEIEALLPRADMVAIAMPSTKATYQMINQKTIALMKDGAMTINVGRGNIIETEALCDALESGKLGAVALDVTDPEPLPVDHRLWDIPNALITPHISGGHQLRHTVDVLIELFEENLQRFFDEQPLYNEVDFEIGYRRVMK